MRFSNWALFLLAGISMLVALAFQTLTLATGDPEDYRVVLLIAFAWMIISNVCCYLLFLRGGWLRLVIFVFALPSLFIVQDFLRRAPHVWGN